MNKTKPTHIKGRKKDVRLKRLFYIKGYIDASTGEAGEGWIQHLLGYIEELKTSEETNQPKD